MKQSIIDVIRERKSIRTFAKESLSKEDIQQIESYLQDHKHMKGPFDQQVKIEFVPVTKNMTDQGIKIGTYGFIKGPKGYLVGMAKNNQEALLNFGYVFEKLILFLTSLNIGTCWLGGTFTRSSFEKELDMGQDDLIPAITPIGYPSEKQRFFEKTLRKMVKADNKKSWRDLFYYHDFNTHLQEGDAGLFNTPIEMVRLGPSASNKQPWRIVYSDDQKTCHFYLEKTPGYSDKLGYEMQLLDLGIAMCHFEVACDELNMNGKWFKQDPNIELLSEYTQYIISYQI